MERFVLGIDIGTTSVKTVLVSGEGVLVDEASASHDLISLHTGWAEEDADKWWRNVKKTLRELSERRPEAVRSAACIGVTGMVPAIVMLDENGAPIRNTIQQNDARSVEEIEFLKTRIDQEDLYEKTGGFTNQQHVLPRMLWVRNHEPEVFARMAHVTGSYDYIAYKLTGALSIEMNWAAESGLFDIRKKEWLTDQMEAFGFRPEWFPRVNESMAVIGHVTDEAADATGLRAGIPVIAGSADHVASTLSAGIINEGDLLIKFGGAGDILYCTEEIATSPKLFFDYHIVPERYLVNGCMAASGSLVKWYLGDILENYGGQALRELDEEASFPRTDHRHRQEPRVHAGGHAPVARHEGGDDDPDRPAHEEGREAEVLRPHGLYVHERDAPRDALRHADRRRLVRPHRPLPLQARRRRSRRVPEGRGPQCRDAASERPPRGGDPAVSRTVSLVPQEVAL